MFTCKNFILFKRLLQNFILFFNLHVRHFWKQGYKTTFSFTAFISLIVTTFSFTDHVMTFYNIFRLYFVVYLAAVQFYKQQPTENECF